MVVVSEKLFDTQYRNPFMRQSSKKLIFSRIIFEMINAPFTPFPNRQYYMQLLIKISEYAFLLLATHLSMIYRKMRQMTSWSIKQFCYCWYFLRYCSQGHCGLSHLSLCSLTILKNRFALAGVLSSYNKKIMQVSKDSIVSVLSLSNLLISRMFFSYFLINISKANLLKGMAMINEAKKDTLLPSQSVKNACRINSNDIVINVISMQIITFSICLLYLLQGYSTLAIAVYPSSPAAIPKTNNILNSKTQSNIKYPGGTTLSVNFSKFHNEDDTERKFLQAKGFLVKQKRKKQRLIMAVQMRLKKDKRMMKRWQVLQH